MNSEEEQKGNIEENRGRAGNKNFGREGEKEAGRERRREVGGSCLKAIRKARDFVWAEGCQKSFDELKEYLATPTLFSRGRSLCFSEVTVSTVLVRLENNVQRPIYYVSKILQDVGTRYPKIDKMALALIISARCIWPYFQSHTIVVLTDQPLRRTLQNLEALGRLVNWLVEFGELCSDRPCIQNSYAQTKPSVYHQPIRAEWVQNNYARINHV
ncbi:hypothetical protein RJ639_023620 [Escallonia herrerae]|uniref:Reverse transcriptase RNase H-like domain-containing protein n=1 Tax=Escallonia herrerae TaxID=1293975 RepID=A0AA89AF74_9ASTE|nr:hypothetical protein RJ639_023620 [Escallonia herrerae]